MQCYPLILGPVDGAPWLAIPKDYTKPMHKGCQGLVSEPDPQKIEKEAFGTSAGVEVYGGSLSSPNSMW